MTTPCTRLALLACLLGALCRPVHASARDLQQAGEYDLLAGMGAAPVIEGAPAAEAPSCQSQLNYSSVFMPPQAQFAFRLYANGTRNYTCQSATLSVGPAMALLTTTGAYSCHGFFVSPFVGYNICSDPATGQPVGKLTLDTTVPGAVFVAPAPDGNVDNEPWGRFKIVADGNLPPVNYLVRYNTTGGKRPEQCTAPRGEWVLVPFTAVLDYYICP